MPVACVITREAGASLAAIRSMPRVFVFNPVPQNDRTLRIALACVGVKDIDMVRDAPPPGAHLSYATEPPSFQRGGGGGGGARTPLGAKIDMEILATLSPNASVRVGSLAHAMPSTAWAKDDGAAVMYFPSDHVKVLRRYKRPNTPYRTNPYTRKPSQPDKRPFRILAIPPVTVPGIFSVGYTRSSVRMSSIQGMALREGDVLVDESGSRWYFLSGRLRDRIPIRVSLRDYAMSSSAIAPLPHVIKPELYVADSEYELTIIAEDGSVAGVRPGRSLSRDSDGWGWNLGGRDDARPYVCVDPGGTLRTGVGESACEASGGTWDRQCSRDDECPYYDARRARGGCTKSGYCEFPLGTSAASYRKATGTALLRGCLPTDPSYPRCSDQPKQNARFAPWKL